MFEVLYEDDNLRVFNKPANLSLLQDRSGQANFWQELQKQSEKPYLVHRLDKGTSGVLLVARRQAAQSELTRAFNKHSIGKFYLAWVLGHFPGGATHNIDLPLCKGRKSRYRVAGQRSAIKQSGHAFTVEPDREGLTALTRARLLKQNNEHSLLLLKPLSGRTHQIRVHLSWLGYPVLGDHLYGRANDPRQQAPRLMLHCHQITVPGWGRFTAPVPQSFQG